MVDPTFPFDPIPQTSLSFVGGIEGDFNNETAGKINVDNQGRLRYLNVNRSS